MKITIRPFDMAAPGSFRVRSRIFRALRSAREGDDMDALAAFCEIEDVVISHLSVDEGTVEDALDTLSADEFDQLLSKLAESMGGEAAIPPTTAAS